MTDPDSASDAADLDALLADLHEHLRATEELPVQTRAGRWLGEAQAVAADLTDDPPPEVVETRISQVRRLLESVDGTGNPEADDHVAAALDLVAAVESRLST